MIRWVLGLYFTGFFLFAFSILLMRSPVKKFFGKQVEKYIKFTEAKEEPQLSLHYLLSKIIDLISPLITKKQFAANLQALIDRAGVPLRASEFIFFHVIGFLVSVIAGYAIMGPAGVLLLAIVAAAFPILSLKYLKRKRENRFHELLPDTLSLVAGALKAGYSFLQAVDMTVKETSPPMSAEFKKVLAEARLGLPLESALDNMAKRVESDNFDWTVMAIKIQREVGGNLAEILEILADTVRERDRVSRQIKVLTAEGRMSAIVLFVLPFAVGILLWILNPKYLSLLFTHSTGLAMLGIAFFMLAIGGMWLKKVVTIEV